MALHGEGRQSEVLTDEAVGPPVGDELEDADLPRGQVGQRRRGSGGDGGALQARRGRTGDDAAEPALEQDAELGTARASGEDCSKKGLDFGPTVVVY